MLGLLERVDEIKAWLFGSGESDLILSYDSDKKYIAQVVNTIDFKTVFKSVIKFPIIFNCYPFKYEVENTLIEVTTSGSTITNPGSIESEPILSVYGIGDITLKINGNAINLIAIKDKLIINSQIEDCYDDATNSLNEKMVGEFPILKIGASIIEWTGSVSKIEVLPNWRWL